MILLLILKSISCINSQPDGSVGCMSTGDQRLLVLPQQGRQHSFVEIDHEIFSMVILSLPLIQDRQLSVSGEIVHN